MPTTTRQNKATEVEMTKNSFKTDTAQKPA